MTDGFGENRGREAGGAKRRPLPFPPLSSRLRVIPNEVRNLSTISMKCNSHWYYQIFTAKNAEKLKKDRLNRVFSYLRRKI